MTNIKAGLDLIEQEFRKRHPQIIRRHELFCLDQQQDEKFSDTITRMMTLAKDSNLVDMLRDQILCHILLRACSRDNELRGKLLEIDSDGMTVDQLVAIVERYELIKITNHGLSSKGEKGFGRKVSSKEDNICYCCQEKKITLPRTVQSTRRHCFADTVTTEVSNCLTLITRFLSARAFSQETRVRKDRERRRPLLKEDGSMPVGCHQRVNRNRAMMNRCLQGGQGGA